MAKKKLTRGISKEFAEAFKKSELFTLYTKHKDELFVGVRNNYVNLYYNCDSIARVYYKTPRGEKKQKIVCKIDKYYIDGHHYKSKSKEKNMRIEPEEICKNYDIIKCNSNKKSADEKKAQSKLVLLNNNNPDSKWFCVDTEWEKAFENKKQKNEADFNGRFDIIAISKDNPHKVALIELKYGSRAIGGASGIYKHIEDFKKFKDKNYFDEMKQEIVDIIRSQQMLGIKIPNECANIKADEIEEYQFFVITLNNNPDKEDGSTPQQTMSGYLFKDKRWGCKRLTTKSSVEDEFGDVTKQGNQIEVSFLFSMQTLKNISINDIINGDYKEKIYPK
jgi:hypothetical protein